MLPQLLYEGNWEICLGNLISKYGVEVVVGPSIHMCFQYFHTECLHVKILLLNILLLNTHWRSFAVFIVSNGGVLYSTAFKTHTHTHDAINHPANRQHVEL